MALNHNNLTPSRLLIRYNGLIKEFIDNAENHEWTLDQVVEFSDRWLQLHSDIDTCFEDKEQVPEQKQIWQNTNDFVIYFQELIDAHAHAHTIHFKFSEDTIEALEDTKLKSFGLEYEETPDFFDEIDEDDDDDKN